MNIIRFSKSASFQRHLVDLSQVLLKLLPRRGAGPFVPEGWREGGWAASAMPCWTMGSIDEVLPFIG